MNIFQFDGEEFDSILDELFENITPEELKKELIDCGLTITEENKDIDTKIIF